MFRALEEHEAETRVLDEEETAAVQKVKDDYYKSLAPMRKMLEKKLE